MEQKTEQKHQYAIVILSPTKEDQDLFQSMEWLEKMRLVQASLQQKSGVQTLGAGIWQFDLSNGLRNFAFALQELGFCKHHPYRVLFFDENPNWIVTEPKKS